MFTVKNDIFFFLNFLLSIKRENTFVPLIILKIDAYNLHFSKNSKNGEPSKSFTTILLISFTKWRRKRLEIYSVESFTVINNYDIFNGNRCPVKKTCGFLSIISYYLNFN